MRHPLLWAIALACLASAVECLAEEAPPSAPKPEVKLEFVYLEFTGVEAAETAAVAKAAGDVAGVRTFAWTAPGTEAKVVREVGKAGDASLIQSAVSAGATTARTIPLAATTLIFETKLHCGGCVKAVNKALRAIKGVKESTVPAEMTSVVAVYDTRLVKVPDIQAALAAIGKPANPAP